jgi:hypothetical protein
LSASGFPDYDRWRKKIRKQYKFSDLFCAGLPDCIFLNQKVQIGVYIWSALEWKMLAYFKAILNILCPFGICYDNFGIFFPVLVYCTKKTLAALVYPPTQIQS